MEASVETRISGGPNSNHSLPGKLAQAIENMHFFTNDHAMSKVASNNTWHNGPIPHETTLALNSTNTFPAQPSMYK